MLRKFLIGFYLLAALGWVPLPIQATDAPLAAVYFMPPYVETYSPVTTSTIERVSFEEWTLTSNEEVSQILSILEGRGPATFDSAKVRLKLVTQQATLFVDAAGVVSTGDLSGRHIDLNALSVFRKSLRPDQMLSHQRK